MKPEILSALRVCSPCLTSYGALETRRACPCRARRSCLSRSANSPGARFVHAIRLSCVFHCVLLPTLPNTAALGHNTRLYTHTPQSRCSHQKEKSIHEISRRTSSGGAEILYPLLKMMPRVVGYVFCALTGGDASHSQGRGHPTSGDLHDPSALHLSVRDVRRPTPAEEGRRGCLLWPTWGSQLQAHIVPPGKAGGEGGGGVTMSTCGNRKTLENRWP